MAKKFDVDSVRHLMKTEPNEALFWSGTTNFPKPAGMSDEKYAAYTESFGGQKTAEAYARRTGRKTLEMKMEENKDALIAAGFPYDPEKGMFIYNDETKGDWESISAAYAEGASGEIEVQFGMDENVIYGDIDSGEAEEYESIWSRQEYERLFSNEGVSKLTAVDPFSEEKSEVFSRRIVDDIVPPDSPKERETLDNIPPSTMEDSRTYDIPSDDGNGQIEPSSVPSSSEDTAGGSSFQSAYTDRIQHTPSLESNRWTGERGESVCAPKSDEARQILEERGMAGVTYQNGVPDFSPFSESTVRLGYMTDARHSSRLDDGRDSKNTIYAHFEDGEMVSSSHRADKESMADIHMKYDKPGNFEQADILTAEQWTADGKDGKEWTAEDVAQYREDNGLTWHECNDMETMQMVPQAINADFGHLGGVAEVKERQCIIDEVLSQEEDGNWLEGDDFERMSGEELKSFNRENGRYDDEGIWISEADIESVEPIADQAKEELIEESVENLAEKPVGEPVEELAKEPVGEPVEELAEKPVREPVEELAKEPVREPVEELAEEPVEELAEEPVGETVEELAEESVGEAVEELAEESVGEAAEELAEKPIEESVEELTEESVEELTEESVDELTEESVDELTEESVEELTEKSVDELTEESVDELTEESVEELTEESVEELTEKSVDELTEESVEESIEESVDELTEESVEELTEESVEELTEESVEESIEESVEELTEESVEELTEESVEESIEESVEELTEESVEELTEESAEELVDDFSDVDESFDDSDITDDYSDLSDEYAGELVEGYDTSEDFNDLSDDISDGFDDESACVDYSDEVIDDPVDTVDFSDISDDIDSDSFDYEDACVDSGDSGFFDGGGESFD